MRYLSTRDATARADLATAVIRGIAPDGGLYLPETIPSLSESALAPGRGQAPPLRRLDASLAETAEAVLAPYLADLPDGERRALLSEALDFPIPLVAVTPGTYVLELFHGPTFAFKDVGARVLARLLAWALRRDPATAGRTATVLVATSGDTGGAVADAFLGVAGTRVAVLFPAGRISPLQEKQLTTLGGNVEAFAVEGTFDDCQRLAKEAFADRELCERHLLTSANSINIGRLLPQVVYAVHAWRQLPAGSPPPVVVVPSGNFGNLAASMIAARAGLPVAHFLAATNANDVVPEYLESGLFSPRPAIPTISNAMDVGNPSNLERIRALFADDLASLRRSLTARAVDDDATRATIRNVWERHGHLLDPHAAVGWRALEEFRSERKLDGPAIVYATAHPVKFREHVEPLIGRPVPLPERLAQRLAAQGRSTPLPPHLRALRNSL